MAIAKTAWSVDPRSGDCLVHADGRASLVVLWIAAGVLELLSIPLVFAVPAELAKGNRAVFIALIFPLAGVVLMIVAIRQTMRFRKYGRAVLVAPSLPVALGNRFQAQLRVPQAVDMSQGMTWHLVCRQLVTQGTGKNRSTSWRLLWEDRRRVAGAAIRIQAGQTLVPVDFSIPYSCKPSTVAERIEWRLSAAAEVPGVDFGIGFKLPVAITEHSDPAYTEERIAAERRRDAVEDMERTHATSKITLARCGDTALQASVPPAAVRAPAGVISLAIAMIIVLAAGYGVHRAGAPIIFPIVCSIAGVVMLLAVAYFCVVTLRLRLTPEGLEILHDYRLFKRPRSIPLADIASFGFAIMYTTQSGTRQRAYYRVFATLADGAVPPVASRALAAVAARVAAHGGQTMPPGVAQDRVGLVGSLRDKDEAVWLAGILNDHLARLRSDTEAD